MPITCECYLPQKKKNSTMRYNSEPCSEHPGSHGWAQGSRRRRQKNKVKWAVTTGDAVSPALKMEKRPQAKNTSGLWEPGKAMIWIHSIWDATLHTLWCWPGETRAGFLTHTTGRQQMRVVLSQHIYATLLWQQWKYERRFSEEKRKVNTQVVSNTKVTAQWHTHFSVFPWT